MLFTDTYISQSVGLLRAGPPSFLHGPEGSAAFILIKGDSRILEVLGTVLYSKYQVLPQLQEK